ncbi:GNAT family N-acetyltransferase [Saccharopolyspora elongata]|nr:GNAT family N-acetyltransferase [Saccharopolyspora elongata]
MVTVRWRLDDDLRKVEALIVEAGWATMAGSFRRSKRPCLVAEGTDGDIVGFIQGLVDGYPPDGRIFNECFGPFEHVDPPHCKIDWICVSKRARRTGVGRRLLHHFAVEASERGCSHVALKADESSDAGGRLAFFEKFGFYPLDPQQPEHLQGVDLATLIKLTA